MEGTGGKEHTSGQLEKKSNNKIIILSEQNKIQ